MIAEVDILENEIIEQYPEVLDILLLDHTTKKNIFWVTNNYEALGNDYQFSAKIGFIESKIKPM